jgi:hypothetical protein
MSSVLPPGVSGPQTADDHAGGGWEPGGTLITETFTLPSGLAQRLEANLALTVFGHTLIRRAGSPETRRARCPYGHRAR